MCSTIRYVDGNYGILFTAQYSKILYVYMQEFRFLCDVLLYPLPTDIRIKISQSGIYVEKLTFAL